MTELHSSPEEVAVQVQRGVAARLILTLLGLPQGIAKFFTLQTITAVQLIDKFLTELFWVDISKKFVGARFRVLPVYSIFLTKIKQSLLYLGVEKNQVPKFGMMHVLRIDMDMQPCVFINVAVGIQNTTDFVDVRDEYVPVGWLSVDLEAGIGKATVAHDGYFKFIVEDMVSVVALRLRSLKAAHLNLHRDVALQFVYLELLFVSFAETQPVLTVGHFHAAISTASDAIVATVNAMIAVCNPIVVAYIVTAIGAVVARAAIRAAVAVLTLKAAATNCFFAFFTVPAGAAIRAAVTFRTSALYYLSAGSAASALTAIHGADTTLRAGAFGAVEAALTGRA